MKKEEFINLDDFDYYAKIFLLANNETKAELITRDLDELENITFLILRSGYDVKIEINPEIKKKYKSYYIIP